MKITGTARHTLVVGGTRTPIRISAGPWVPQVDPRQVVLYATKFDGFSESVRAEFSVINDTDSREDYFEKDRIKLLPGHPLYETAKQLAN